MSYSLLISCLWKKACHMFWKQRDGCQNFRTPRVGVGGGVLVGFWSCSLLKTREDESKGKKKATSKAQAIAATHALHALSIPKEKKAGEWKMMGVLWSGESWHICQFSFSATVKSYVKKSKLRRIMVTAHHWIPDKNDQWVWQQLKVFKKKNEGVWCMTWKQALYKEVEKREKGICKQMIGVAEWGGEMALVASCSRASLFSGDAVTALPAQWLCAPGR